MCLSEALAVEAAEDGGEVGGQAGGEEGVFLVRADDVWGGGEGVGERWGRLGAVVGLVGWGHSRLC